MILLHFTRCREFSEGLTFLNFNAITLALVSYLRSLVVRAVHRHRTGVGSIPAGGPIVDEFFSTLPGWNFDLCRNSTRYLDTLTLL